MKRLLYILFIAIVSLPMFAATELDSLFYQALLDENYELMTKYAKQGANVNITPNNSLGVTILHNGAMYGNMQNVQWCVENNADVNAKDLNGLTPLHYAAITQQTTICKILLEHGADINSAAAKGITAIDIAEMQGNPELVKYLKAPKKNKIPTDFNEIRINAILAEKNNDFPKAIKDLQAAIKEADKTLSPSNKFYTLLWVDLANAYSITGEKEKAEEAFNEGFTRAQKYAYGREIYYRALAERSVFLLNERNEDSALDSLLECGKHMDEFSDFETKYAVMYGIGNGAISMLLFDNAIDILYQALSYSETLMFLNKQVYEDFYYSTILTICHVLEGQGTAGGLNEAMALLFNIDDAFLNRHDYLSALYAIYKGKIYFLQGDYYRAEKWYLRAEKDWYMSRGTRHDVYATILYHLGEINTVLNRYEDAVSYFKISLGYRIENKATNTIFYALGLNGLAYAMLFSNINGGKQYTYTDIDDNLYGAINKIHKIKGRENLEFLSAVSTLCQSLYIQRNDTLADFYTIPLNLTRKLVPPESTFYQARLLDSYLFAEAVNDTVLALSNIVEYDTISKKSILDYFLVLPEEQRYQYWTSRDYSAAFESIIPTYIHSNILAKPSLAEMAFDDALFRKGILLNTTKVIVNSINNSNDTLLINLFHRLIADKSRYSQLSASVAGEQDNEMLISLQDSINDFEHYITSKCREYVDYKALGNLSWTEIKDALRNDQSAVEIIRFEYYSRDSVAPSYYVATIVTPTSERPEYVYLCKESELSSLIEESNKDNVYSYSRNGQQLSRLIWGKLIPYIGDARTIYFSPDGLLCQLAVEALPLTKDSVYGDAYDIVRCSSTKYILQQQKDERPTQVDLFGGIQYDMTPTEMTNQSNAFAMRSAYRGEMPDSLSRGHYDELLGAKAEVNNIARLLNNANIKSNLFTGSNATEEEFKALSGTHPNVLHIATHGFFWPYEEATRKDYFMASLIANNKTSRYVSSMERSGLLFAGANVAMTGHRDELPSNVEDGVLSAQEISTMDLYGTDLVVLSACETGQGDIESDGVYGLQRAFKLAGVRTIIMSLWKVNDAATQMLMTEFYTNWITNKMSKRKAFETAKQKVRVNHPEPSCWAGFIMLD